MKIGLKKWRVMGVLGIMVALAVGLAYVTRILVARSLDLHGLVQIGDVEGVAWILAYAGRVDELAIVTSVGYEIVGSQLVMRKDTLTPLAVGVRNRQHACWEGHGG